MGKAIYQPTIDTHPQRDKILEALIAGEPVSSIARWCNPRLHRTTIWRYMRKKIARALEGEPAVVFQKNDLRGVVVHGQNGSHKSISATNTATGDDPIVHRLMAKYDRFDHVILEILQQKDFAAFASIDKAETAAMRLHAELCGRLQGATNGAQVQIVIGDKSVKTEAIRLDDAPEATIDIATSRE